MLGRPRGAQGASYVPGAPDPIVSVLMPTYKQAAFLPAALERLCAQTFTDWELVVVDDGSPDDTAGVLAPYRTDPRLRYYRLPCNRGVGHALNVATALARGRYLAYLPSDDRYYPEHLAACVGRLETDATVDLAYGGVRWGRDARGPTLQGASAVGHEAEVLANVPPPQKEGPLPRGNILAPVQVVHRRTWEAAVRWTPREARVFDTLEPDFWRAAGAGRTLRLHGRRHLRVD